MNHRLGRNIFGLAVGLVVALFAFQWISNPEPRAQRAKEEQAVVAARSLLVGVLATQTLDIVDPLEPNRKVGKAYVYAEPPGWAVSGYYRRGQSDRWHPFLLTMNGAFELLRLKVEDGALAHQASEDPRILLIE